MRCCHRNMNLMCHLLDRRSVVYSTSLGWYRCTICTFTMWCTHAYHDFSIPSPSSMLILSLPRRFSSSLSYRYSHSSCRHTTTDKWWLIHLGWYRCGRFISSFSSSSLHLLHVAIHGGAPTRRRSATMEEETMRTSFYQYETVGYIINRALLLVGSWLYVLCCCVAKIMNYMWTLYF